MSEVKKFTVEKLGESKTFPNSPVVGFYEVLIEQNGVVFGTRLQSTQVPDENGVRELLNKRPKDFWIEVTPACSEVQKKDDKPLDKS